MDSSTRSLSLHKENMVIRSKICGVFTLKLTPHKSTNAIVRFTHAEGLGPGVGSTPVKFTTMSVTVFDKGPPISRNSPTDWLMYILLQP